MIQKLVQFINIFNRRLRTNKRQLIPICFLSIGFLLFLYKILSVNKYNIEIDEVNRSHFLSKTIQINGKIISTKEVFRFFQYFRK